MATARTRTAQQRDARELALTRPPDPYRGGLTDPYGGRPVASQPPGADQPVPGEPPVTTFPATDRSPTSATFAGILGIALGLTLALFAMLLLTILSLQNDYGAPDRSFYRGTDSGYLVLALVDFGLAVACALGGIVLMTGRVSGRIAMTVGGWGTLLLAAFWYLRGELNPIAPVIMAIAALAMLMLCYQRSVTRWLGVLPAPQPG